MANDGIIVRDLGRVRYEPALAIQRQLNQAVIDGRSAAQVLLVEHEPVITLTPRQGIERHVVASSARLAELGIAVCQTDRGGDVTYHGPGQLVVYPILRLGELGLNLSRYMRLLEQVVIDTAESFGVRATRVAGCTGVWAESGGGTRPQAWHGEQAKLCALGVRVRRNVTMHGLALNVTTDLSHFQTIVPCGLANRSVTSLRELLGETTPTMRQVKQELAGRLLDEAGRLRQSTSTK